MLSEVQSRRMGKSRRDLQADERLDGEREREVRNTKRR